MSTLLLGIHGTVKLHSDENGILDEFRMFWDLRNEFPVHFTVFKQQPLTIIQQCVEYEYTLARYS